MKSQRFLSAIVAALSLCVAVANAKEPAPVPREFRAAWIATVGNIDWPSKQGLSTEQQKRELIELLDKAVELNLNAIIFQVRPSADALYASQLEPWSEYITGKMGQAPEPFYDPLEFAVEEAHKRGLQLHAWFNPYRVRPPGASKQPASPDHVSVAQPELVRQYGEYQWFDPGEPASIDHFTDVLADVVKRYDIDGVHIDDYFYPYQIKKDDKVVSFPDDESYQRAVAKGEKLDRDDWRRQNVNHLVERMYRVVKNEKPWVLVGISPFGIWRPQNPPGVVGLDQYATLYADARKWQQEGWVDYLTPQIYWTIDSNGQSYPKLLSWWAEQNTKQRHLWPGNFTSKVRRKHDTKESKDVWSAEELIRQIETTRATPGATGNVHFSMKALRDNYDGLSDKLKAGLYAEPALVPESSWLGKETPKRPEVSASRTDQGMAVEMKLPGSDTPWQWVVRVKAGDDWETKIVPGSQSQYVVKLDSGDKATAVTVSAVTRLGREGPAENAKIEKVRN